MSSVYKFKHVFYNLMLKLAIYSMKEERDMEYAPCNADVDADDDDAKQL